MSSPLPFVVQNNMALVSWAFLIVWTSVLLIATWGTLRDALTGGPAASGWTPLILVVVWIASLALMVHVFGMRRVRATFAAGRVEIIRRGLFDTTRWEGPVRSVADAVLEEGDSDGARYFLCVMTIPGSGRVVIAEGHDREAIEGVRDRVNAIRAAAG